jgi:uncharacterized protein (TIGR00251 family)
MAAPNNPGKPVLSETFFEVKDGNLILNVKVVPGASKTELAGIYDGRLRIKIAAAPEDGKANECLAAFLSKLLGCRKKEITITSGERSHRKTLSLPALYAEKAAGLF